MTRKKSNVKALALAVTCAILAGGGISLEPVYAEDVQLNVNNGTIATGSVIGTIQGKVDGKDITEGTISGGSLTGGTFNGTVTLTGDNIKTAIEGVDISRAKVGSDTNSLTIGGLAANTQKIIYNASTGTTVDGVVLKDKGITAADGKFKVDGTNAETVVSGDNGKTTIYGGGITVDSADNNRHVLISDGGVVASGSVTSTIIADVGGARMEKGNVVAKNSLYIGATNIVDPTQDNSKFYVSGESGNVVSRGIVYAKGLNVAAGKFTVDSKNGSFKAANGAFNVSDGGAITADSLTLADSYDVKQNIEDAKSKITTVEGELNTNKANLTALQGRVDDHDTEIGALKTKTQGITRVEGNSTTVEGVNFKDGAVSGVKSINGRIKISTDGKTVTFNEGVGKGQVIISENGIKVGTGSTYVSGDAVYTGGADYDAAKAGMKKDGSLKATGFSVDGATGNTTVGGDLTVKGAATFAKETAFANGIKTDTISEKTEKQGVTVDGVLLKDGGVNASSMSVTGKTGSLNVQDIDGHSTMIYTKAADGTNTIWIDPATGNISTNGTLQVGGGVAGKKPSVTIDGATGSIQVGKDGTEKFAVDGETGNVKTEGSLEVASNATVGGTLGVTGKTTLKDELQVDKKATFGTAEGAQTFIEGNQVRTGRIETDTTQASKIGGVILHNGGITADSMTINGNIDLENLKVKNELTVGTNTKITEGTLQLGIAEENKLTAEKLGNINQTIKSGKVIDANSATIGGVEINGGNVTATGTVKGKTIYDGVGAKLENGKITAQEGQIGNVAINAAGEVTGVSSIKANTFKVDEDNYLNSNGIKAKGGEIGGAKIDATTLSIGGTKLDNAEGITTNKLKIDGMTLTDTKLDTGAATFEVNGVKFNQGQVTAHADKGFVAGNSYFKQGSLIVDANNKLETTNGLTTEKATVKGDLDVTGNATFGTTGKQTTIKGEAITTDTLRANKLILGASGDTTVEVNKDGSLKAADGKFVVDKDGALKAANGAFNVDKDGKTNFKKDDNNLSYINGGNIWAKATDVDNHTSSVLQHDSKGLHVKGNKAGETSAFDFDAATGVSTFTGQDGTTTTINGSAITSTKAAGNTGVLDGSNLTLTNGDNKTEMTAGGATFTKDGKTTIISGDTITTGTLNVTDIVLGGTMYDTAGKPLDGKLSIGNDGHLRAANGNFDVKDDGTFKNTVGNTTLKTDTTGASMKFDNTAADGGVKSEVAVADGKAEMAVGANAAVTTTDGKVEIKGGTQTVTTTDKGTVFENTAHKDPFVENGATNTIINGNEITTGKITTDELVITGKGDAAGPGTGSLAFGGNGTIKSDVKEDGSTNNTQFTTDINGVNTKVTDGTTTTENNVSAAGNSNTVTNKDATQKSEFNQGLTSIGGVVTNGEIKVAQKLDGATGLLTNEVTDANGSSKLEQSGTGLTYTDSANTGNATRINSSDVSIGSATNEKDRINLSDLGQIDNLDTELTARDEYKDNPTAVGGINAEAAIRREEVARLDGRINDVNDRVNKVGAMAAAIASLKSIGYDPQAPSEFSIGLGQYKGETGVAMGFFHYPNKNFMINVSLSTAGGETMGGIGATWRFGHKSPQKLLEEQREAQAKKELAAAEKYQAAAKLAKEAQERAEYAAKLARQAQVSADNAKAAADATQAKHFG